MCISDSALLHNAGSKALKKSLVNQFQLKPNCVVFFKKKLKGKFLLLKQIMDSYVTSFHKENELVFIIATYYCSSSVRNLFVYQLSLNLASRF